MSCGDWAHHERELRRRQGQSQRRFYRVVAAASRDARLLEIGDVQATIVPVRPHFSFFNSVLYHDPAALQRALPRLAREYARAGVSAWTVWVRPGDARARDAVAAAEHVCDSGPMLMGAPIAAIDLETPGRSDVLETPKWMEVARCNDRAHGVPEQWSMAAVFENADDPASHLYAVARDGAIISALVAREHDGDCYFWFVATVPEAQREGLASELMRHALREAARRGCTTTPLESTRAGEAVYARLGYRSLGRFQLCERRAA